MFKTRLKYSKKLLTKYQYSNMAPRLSGQTSIVGVVFFVFKSPLEIERQKKLKKPRGHVRILIYRTWPIMLVILSRKMMNDFYVFISLKIRLKINNKD